MRARSRRSRWVGLWGMLAILVTALPVAIAIEEEAAEAQTTTAPGAVELVAQADAQIDSSQPDTALGGQDFFDVYGGDTGPCVLPGGTTFGLLRFDVSSLPADIEATGVSLRMFNRAGYAVNGDGNHHIIDLGDVAWDENTVTWNTRPDDGTEAFVGNASNGDPTLRNGGGDLRVSDRAVGSAFTFRASCNVDNQPNQRRIFPTNNFDAVKDPISSAADFVTAVEAARARGSQELNLMVFNPVAVIGTNRTGYWARWHSREAADPAVRPTLVVSFASADVVQATPTTDGLAVAVRATGEPDTTLSVSIVGGSGCPSGVFETGPILGSLDVDLDSTGTSYAAQTFPGAVPFGVDVVVAQVSDPVTGETSAASECVAISPDNDVWTRAVEINLFEDEVPNGTLFGSGFGVLDRLGTARWFRVQVTPGSTLEVDLEGPAEDYDLAVFRDIAVAFAELDDLDDLHQLGAEFAPSVFSPSVFSPSVFSPSVFSPDAFAPSVFSPSVFSPSVFSPSVFSPSVFSPSVFSPSVFSPSVFSPSVFSPSVFSPSVFSPSVFSPAGLSPSVFSPENFASAQTRSITAVAATAGTSSESVSAQTWNDSGDFYIRVSGRNGAFNPDEQFFLSVQRRDLAECQGVLPFESTAVIGGAAMAGDFETVILTDSSRLDAAREGNTAADVTAMNASIGALAVHPQVNGVVVDLATDVRVSTLNAQADANPGCPYAKNLVAYAIKDIIDGLRATNDIKHVAVIGDDEIIPFFRYPDPALLGPESQYVPPVLDSSAAQAALRLNFVLGQDEYGSSRTVAAGETIIPIPDLPVGRLVETASEITTVIDAYLGLSDGVAPAPQSSFVSGYDFLTDTADAVSASLSAGIGNPVNELITAADISPQDPRSWTATDLADEFLTQRHDLAFLAGHFSANSALAADYETSLLTTQLRDSTVDMTNMLVASAGCHSGYNIVTESVIDGVTEPLDWAQAFAQKGATLIAGTGYQYGDTDFIEYSERLYAGFFEELREGTGPVGIGDALVEAKQEYLATTPDPRGLHAKSLIQATIFGLPMFSIDLPTGRVPDEEDPESIATNVVEVGPGSELGLRTRDETVDTSGNTRKNVELDDLSSEDPIVATYFEGPDGVVTNPAEPAIPLVVRNAESGSSVLRGVGFRGGPYTDEVVVPLTGAPTTEIRGVHVPFASDVFFPMRLVNISHYSALTGQGTQVLITPAQHRSIGGNNSVLRTFGELDLRYYYSDNLDSVALTAPPSIKQVDATPVGADVLVEVIVVGNPSAGIQEVWVTYTGDGPMRWAPLDLVQCVDDDGPLPDGCEIVDSTKWVGTIAGAAASIDSLALIANAVNGLGLVTLQDSFGAYHNAVVASSVAPSSDPTSLAFDTSVPSTAPFGSTVTVSAVLTSNGQPVVDEEIVIGLGATGRSATTDANGRATADVPITAAVGSSEFTATFAGATGLESSSAQRSISVTKAPTSLELSIDGAPSQVGGGLVDLGVRATLLDNNGAGLLDRTVYFSLSGAATGIVPVRTDFLGQATLMPVAAGGGTVTVEALFLPDTIGTVQFSENDPEYDPSTADSIAVVVEALPSRAVLVTGRPVPTPGDRDLVQIAEDLGFEVVVVDDDTPDLRQAVIDAEPGVVLLSTSVVLSKVGEQLALIPYPLVTWEAFLHDEMGLAVRAGRSGETSAGNSVDIVMPEHPVAAGLTGRVRVSGNNHGMSGLFPAGDGTTIAIASHQRARTVIATWEAGDATQIGPAPARIVAIFPNYFSGQDLTVAGADLFGAALTWAVGGGPVVPANEAPVVDAGTDQNVVLPNTTVSLDGTVSDDGLPASPGAVTTEWRFVSGPGPVTFTDASAVDTTAQLPAQVGVYVVALEADDGQLVTTDTVEITVRSDTPEVVFVSSRPTPPPGDQQLLGRLQAAPVTVTIVDDDDLATTDLSTVTAVFVSTSVKISVVGDQLRDLDVPVVMWEGYLFDDMGLGRSGESAGTFNRIDIVSPGNSLAAGLAGSPFVMTTPNKLSWARVADSADVIAIEPGNPSHSVIWKYEAGDLLFDGSTAAGDRYGFFADYFGATRLNPNGVALFDAIVAAAVGLP